MHSTRRTFFTAMGLRTKNLPTFCSGTDPEEWGFHKAGPIKQRVARKDNAPCHATVFTVPPLYPLINPVRAPRLGALLRASDERHLRSRCDRRHRLARRRACARLAHARRPRALPGGA